MIKVATIVGARPQFVKAAALSRSIREAQKNGISISETLIHTGQHYDANMSDVFFQELEIPKPQHYLGIGGCSHGAMTGRMMEEIEKILMKERPDWVVVFGDTNSTLAGALTAVKMHIPTAHVEAGLRSFNRAMPEEINRIVTDHCANLLLTPSENSTKQLLKEGIPKQNIVQVGDIMHDAALYYYEKALSQNNILKKWNLEKNKYALATIHRAENTDNIATLEEIFTGLQNIAQQGMKIIVPLHPRTKLILEKSSAYNEFKRHLTLIEPVGYLDMILLESHAKIILTDSGGVQKEAYFFKIPCITLRNETEWTELVECGYNRLSEIKNSSIVSTYFEMIDKKMNWDLKLYGEGVTAKTIVNKLLSTV